MNYFGEVEKYKINHHKMGGRIFHLCTTIKEIGDLHLNFLKTVPLLDREAKW